MINLYMCREGEDVYMECMITLYMCREGEDVYMECIDDNPVYV